VDTLTQTEVGSYQIITVVTDQLWDQRCFIVTHRPSGEQVLIDPGNNPNLIIKAVADNGIGQLSHILLTHAHFDHVSAVASICNRFNVACHVQEADVRLLIHAPLYAFRFARRRIPMPEPFIVFEEKPDITIGGKSIKVIHLPGHSKGSVCYAFDGFAFPGDTLMYKCVGRTDLPGCDRNQLIKSVNLILKNLPEQTVLFGGHGKQWTISSALRWWQDIGGIPQEYKDFVNASGLLQGSTGEDLIFKSDSE